MSGELFMMMTGCKMTHIPYKGAGPALTDLIGGQVHVLFDNMPSSIGHIRGGSIRPIAVTTSERSPALPNVPTVADTVKGYEASAWFGIGMPKGTPREIVDKLNAAIQEMFKDPKMRDKLAELGGVPLPGTADDFGKVVQSEVDKWAKVVKASGATVE
jgi:tripartite-type tricarboxylate transporter receptor subunit TctC